MPLQLFDRFIDRLMRLSEITSRWNFFKTFHLLVSRWTSVCSYRATSWIGLWTGSSPTWMTWTPWTCLKVADRPQRAKAAETPRRGLASKTDRAVSYEQNTLIRCAMLKGSCKKSQLLCFWYISVSSLVRVWTLCVHQPHGNKHDVRPLRLPHQERPAVSWALPNILIDWFGC